MAFALDRVVEDRTDVERPPDHFGVKAPDNLPQFAPVRLHLGKCCLLLRAQG